MRGALLASAVLPCAAGHGTMMMPPSWHDPNGFPGMTAMSQCSGSMAGGDQGHGLEIFRMEFYRWGFHINSYKSI